MVKKATLTMSPGEVKKVLATKMTSMSLEKDGVWIQPEQVELLIGPGNKISAEVTYEYEVEEECE